MSIFDKFPANQFFVCITQYFMGDTMGIDNTHKNGATQCTFLTQQFLENPNIDNKKAAYMTAFLSFTERIFNI